MRVAVLTNAYPPQARGGAGRIAALQVELFQAAGHEVRVWSASLEWTGYSFLRRALFHLRDLVWLHPAADEIVAWRPDVLITHNLTGVGFRTPSGIQRAFFAKTHQNLRWVHVLHDVQLFHPLGLLSDESSITVLQRLVTCVRQVVFKKPDAVVSPTKWLLSAHTRRGWFKGVEQHVIPNPAPAFEADVSRNWRDPLQALFVGRVTPDKGSELLTHLMKTADRPIAWRVIGAQSDVLTQVELSAGSTLTTQPESSSDVILQAMREADVLLIPSQIEENQPTVILEAFASGLPVIGQAKGGISETIGEAGLVVQEPASSAWVKALNQLTSLPRSTWSARVASAWQCHVPERVVEELANVVKSNKKI